MNTKFKQLLNWLGASEEDIKRLAFLAFQISEVEGARSDGDEALANRWYNPWAPVDLPPGSQPLASLSDETDPNFRLVLEYLESRGPAILNGYDYYWTPSTDHLLHQRLILPFFHRDEIVGYTARYAGTPPPGHPKYWNSSVPQGFLFNNQVSEIPGRKFVVVTEGPFDAIATQGVAAMGATLSEHQVHWLMNTDKEIVVLPDRQRTNQTLIDTALSFGWAVSFPDWEDDVKDGADACARYGQIYTISSVLESRTTNPIEIGVKRKMFRG